MKWAWSLPNGHNEATPLEHDGVLFVDSYGDKVQALNAFTGDLLWQYSRQLPSDARLEREAQFALYRRSGSIVPTSDDHIVALDVKTGDVVWDSALADYNKGYQTTGGPLVAKGKVMQGIAGQAPGGNFIVALDVETGKEAWRFTPSRNTASPATVGTACRRKAQWRVRLDSRQLRSPAGLAYFGVGQTYDTGPVLHRVPGFSNDGLFTDCTLAFDPDTGKLVWYFQHVHNDQWDLDWAFEQQLINLPVDGADKKMVVTSGKMGIYEGMDAATGKYIFSHDLGHSERDFLDRSENRREDDQSGGGDWRRKAAHDLPASGRRTKLDRRLLRCGEEDCLRRAQRIMHGSDSSGAGPAREFDLRRELVHPAAS